MNGLTTRSKSSGASAFRVMSKSTLDSLTTEKNERLLQQAIAKCERREEDIGFMDFCYSVVCD